MEWNAKTATVATASFWVKGQADLDDVILTSLAQSFLANKSVEPDQRRRVPFWNEERESLLPGRRAGRFRSDPEVKHGDKHGLQLTATGDWYAFSSVNWPLPGWTERHQLSGWIRCDDKASGQLLACWLDDRQKVLRVDASPSVQAKDWQAVSFTPPAPPSKASTIRLVAVARGGNVWFDDFEILRLAPRQQVVQVFVNQIGYDASGHKSAVVATNFFPQKGEALSFQLLGKNGEIAGKHDLSCAGRIHSGKEDDWGWYFWRADFSACTRSGSFRAAAQLGHARGESVPFAIGPGLLLKETAQSAVDFFYIQRCGCDVPGWHKACHLDDAKLPDGKHLDVTGGWHSAGDYNKPMWQFGDSAAVYALVSALQARPRVFHLYNRDPEIPSAFPDALDEALWGASFLAKMQNPADGSMRGDVLQGPARTWMKWSAPDVHTDNKVGTRDDPVIAAGAGNTPLAVAGWASLARSLDERGFRHEHVDRARRLWTFLTAKEVAADNPLLLVSALEMHRTTKEKAFQEFARKSAERLLKQQKPNGAFPGDSGDHGDWTAAALALYALEYPKDTLGDRVVAALRRYLQFCLSRADNPFGLSRQGVEEKDAAFFHPSVGLGVNFWLLGRAWAALLIYRLTNDREALVYAVDQIDWVLGKNPVNLCMFEGKGTVNPPRYHHRYNMIPGRERGAVPGAIANGFVRDMGLADRPGFDMSRAGGRSPSFRTSEPWLVHNILYLLAVSALPQS